MDEKIDEYIKDLRHAVTVAGLNYEIWWTYVEKESREKYVDVMNQYSLFFRTSIHAHFVALVIALYRLYENNQTTVNIPGLLRIIKQHHPFGKETENKILELSTKAQPLFEKIAILRNNVFGHSSAKLTAKDSFAKAGITPNEFRGLIETTKELLNEITHEWDRSTHMFNLGSGESVTKLLDDLSELREYCSNKRLNKNAPHKCDHAC